MLRPKAHQKQRGLAGWIWGLALLVTLISKPVYAVGDICVTCQKEIRFSVYTREDKVTHTRKFLCSDCLALPDCCYLCSIPVTKDLTRLNDGRVICKRDVSSVVLDDREAGQICDQVRKDLDRQFSRFLAMPNTHTTVQLMDRIKLLELYKVIGNDYSCPNTLGCTETKSQDGRTSYEISILSGQPRENLITTCVHEYAHTWIYENVPPWRRKRIGKDAVEGFCELLSFLFAEQQGLLNAQSNILGNFYTRGQIHLFIAAQRQYGLEDAIDWMKFGEDPLLWRDDLSRIRKLEDRARVTTARTQQNTTLTSNYSAIKSSPTPPDALVLQGIVWSKTQPMATINGKNFDLNQEASLPLRNGSVQVRCLEIRPTAVLLQTNSAAEPLLLELK